MKVKIRKYNCIICNNEFESDTPLLRQECFCSEKCREEYNEKYQKVNKCIECGDEFHVYKSDTKFCGYKCKLAYNTTNRPKKKYKCDNCGNDFDSPYRGGKHKFCNRECYLEYDKKHRTKPTIKCPICNNDFTKKRPSQRFCSMTCQAVWQSQNRKRNPVVQKQTQIERMIQEVLDKKQLKYKTNQRFSYYELDFYLEDCNLGIEIMGEYWHAEVRKYSKINEIQYQNILRDKRKSTYFTNRGIKVLYLWEEDIRNNLKMCELLIQNYLDKNGELEYFHSINYKIINGVIQQDFYGEPYMLFKTKDLKTIKREKRETKK